MSTAELREHLVAVEARLDQVKPHLRGWLHAGAVPAAVVCGVILIVLSPPQLRLAAVIYVTSTVALFSISAVYHRGNWKPKTHRVLQRVDHATIFLLIAGSYTPFAAALVHGGSGVALLWIVWIIAAVGILFQVLWASAPKWLAVPVYIAMGWTAMFFLPQIWRNGGVVVFVLLLSGGLFYSVGGVIFAMRRPNPSPKWFGFHEVFHSCTLGGFVTHYIAISLAVYGATQAAVSF